MRVTFIAIGMCTNECIASFATRLCTVLQNLLVYYRLDTATKEGFRQLDHHDIKISILKSGFLQIRSQMWCKLEIKDTTCISTYKQLSQHTITTIHYGHIIDISYTVQHTWSNFSFSPVWLCSISSLPLTSPTCSS